MQSHSADLRPVDLNAVRQATLLLTTWNAGNAEPMPSDLAALIPDNARGYDLVVMGFQESTYSVKEKHSSAIEPCIVHLQTEIEAQLQVTQDAASSPFFLVRHCRRAQMQLFVYARTSLRPFINNVVDKKENTGILGVFPNKVSLNNPPTHTHTQTQTQMHTQYKYLYIHLFTRAHTHTHTHLPTYIYIYTHTYTRHDE